MAREQPLFHMLLYWTLALGTGCTSIHSLVRDRAAYDLNCESHRVNVTDAPGGYWSYRATGCDKEAIYVYLEKQHTVTLNSTVRDLPPEQRVSAAGSPPPSAGPDTSLAWLRNCPRTDEETARQRALRCKELARTTAATQP